MSKLTRSTINANAPIDYYYQAPKSGAPLFLLLHGFAQQWSDVYQELGKILPQGAGVLALMGSTLFLKEIKKPTNGTSVMPGIFLTEKNENT